MNLLRKFFSRKVKVELTGNDSISALEIDPTKHYILIVKTGSMNNKDLKSLKFINPEQIMVVSVL